MIVCNRCGRQHPDSAKQSFCTCGAYLEFESKPVADPPPPPPPPVMDEPERQDLGPSPVPSPDPKPIPTPRPQPAVLGPARGLHPGDLICPNCQDGNEPSRRYCHRCGASLQGAKLVQESWFRRLRARLTPEPGAWQARPAWLVPALLTLLALAVLAGLVVVALYIRGQIGPTYSLLPTSGATASSESPGHAAGLAVDGYKGTYWEASTSPRAPVLTVDFKQGANVDAVIFTSGPSGDFRSAGRAHMVTLTFTDGTSRSFALKDTADAQAVDVQAHGVTAVQIRIDSTYPGQQPNTVALREVEFFVKS